MPQGQAFMVKSVAGIRRRIGQIGIVPRLLMAFLTVVVVAVLVLQAWTLRIVEASETRLAQQRLDINLAVLKEVLHQRGTKWGLDDDGRLTLDGKVADMLQKAVEDVSRITHGAASVFVGDTRVATTVTRPDGSPGIGTTLAEGAARDAVIGHGQTFRGVNNILGVDEFTVYEPLRDTAGRQIGILFVGVPRTYVQAVLDAIIERSVTAAAVVLLAVGGIGWLMLRANLRPLQALAGAVRGMGDGRRDIPVPCADRADQLGEIGRAVEMLREKAAHAQALERRLLESVQREASVLHETNEQLAQANADLELGRLQFKAVLDNISQGLTFFDGNQRLIVCNRRYIEIYQLTEDQTRPGTSLSDILDYRRALGNLPDMTQAEFLARRDRLTASGQAFDVMDELCDGRTILMHYQPLANNAWVSTHEDVTERRRAENALVFMARHDALTKLPNRTLFRERLEHAIAMSRRGTECALLCLDLDRFKIINDTLGHPVGDKLLCAVAERLLAAVREVDTVARLGGDEFAIIQVGLSVPENAAILSERVIRAICEPYDIDGHRLSVGVSIGIAIVVDNDAVAETLLKDADIALYLAKSEGRGVYRFFEPEMDARVQARRELELDLRAAWLADELELHYQPFLNLNSGKVMGFEALMRWNHPVRGVIKPADLVSIAEETGLIIQIGEWVLRKACQEAANWPEGIDIAVNLSPVQFKGGHLLDVIERALEASGLAASRLELEITESVLLQNSDDRLALLHQLNARGIRIALDDFGTGYSSLGYLRSFPFDKIKIDKSFISDIDTNKDSVVIVNAIINLADGLGMTTTAEGVETPEQLAALRAFGCANVQGYLFSSPLSASDVSSMINTLHAADTMADANAA